ncbi:MAG: VOC family protein [Terriglobales bacterium]
MKAVAINRIAAIAGESNDYRGGAATSCHRLKRACEFLCGKLGFSLVFSYGKPPYYAQVRRDAARLNLRLAERPVLKSAVREREELLSVSMTVATAEEIKLLFLEFQSAGVDFQQTLKKQPWGARNFVVRDPDRNLLLFAGPAS